ncbi:hypothetical protein V5O48_011331 [Marasmius crinis-equi]|uniref:Uncharacterized protein n=1 Tax=Marasmius crinis-equi TaxID=585013 RepID=A0ABR3F5Y7_9AGAR
MSLWQQIVVQLNEGAYATDLRQKPTDGFLRDCINLASQGRALDVTLVMRSDRQQETPYHFASPGLSFLVNAEPTWRSFSFISPHSTSPSTFAPLSAMIEGRKEHLEALRIDLLDVPEEEVNWINYVLRRVEEFDAIKRLSLSLGSLGHARRYEWASHMHGYLSDIRRYPPEDILGQLTRLEIQCSPAAALVMLQVYSRVQDVTLYLNNTEQMRFEERSVELKCVESVKVVVEESVLCGILFAPLRAPNLRCINIRWLDRTVRPEEVDQLQRFVGTAIGPLTGDVYLACGTASQFAEFEAQGLRVHRNIER